MACKLSARLAEKMCSQRFLLSVRDGLQVDIVYVEKERLDVLPAPANESEAEMVLNGSHRVLTGFAHRRCRQGERMKKGTRIKRRARARAGLTFCQHARPVNRCKKLIKSQEKYA